VTAVELLQAFYPRGFPQHLKVRRQILPGIFAIWGKEGVRNAVRLALQRGFSYLFESNSLVILRVENGRTNNPTRMPSKFQDSSANYLRIHRRSVGLSQAQLGRVLGYRDETAVAKHECFESIPPFLTALGYEVIFQIPASEIFAGVRQTVAIGIEARLAEFEQRLREKGNRVYSPGITRTLEWLGERRTAGTNNNLAS
jgi:hypothetical protein